MPAYSIRTDTGEISFQPSMFQLFNFTEADQTVTNSATVVAVPNLTFPIAAGERYLLRYTIFYTTTATGGFRYRISSPGTPTLYREARAGLDMAGAALSGAIVTAQADGTITAASGTDGILVVNSLLIQGNTFATNTGNVTFSFAQQTATAAQSAIVRAGSYLEVRKF